MTDFSSLATEETWTFGQSLPASYDNRCIAVFMSFDVLLTRLGLHVVIITYESHCTLESSLITGIEIPDFY